MNIKTHLFPILLLAAVFTGCNENEDNPEPEPPVQQVLTIAPEGIDAAILAGTYPLTITSTQAWTAEVDAATTWCVISPNASFGDDVVTVSVIADNPVPQTRAATITFTSGSLTATAIVTQADAVPILEVDKTKIPAEGHATDYVIAITSNTTWTATVNPETATWCTLADASTAGNGQHSRQLDCGIACCHYNRQRRRPHPAGCGDARVYSRLYRPARRHTV
jgi:hypothetical protein